MKLTEKRCRELIDQSIMTIYHLCDIMCELQNRTVVVDMPTIRVLTESEDSKIKYYNNILISVFDVPDYLESTNYAELMQTFEVTYADTKEWIGNVKKNFASFQRDRS